MLEWLIEIDKKAFLFINNGCSSSLLDFLCPWIRTQEIWYPLYLLVLIGIIRKYKNQSWIILLTAALMVFASDQFSANLVKNTFMRIRPCAEPTLQGMVHHLISSCNGYSFISAHATNHFAIALFVPFYFKDQKWMLPALVFWAALISFSQVYVGVHYPADVLAGALCGVLFGIAFSRYAGKFINLKR